MNFFDVVHDGRHDAAGGVRLEELGVLAEDFVEDGLAHVGDGGDSDVVYEIVAAIVGQAFDEEDGEDGDGDHGPDVADGGGHDLAEVERVA